jgi:exonuclease VII small subunit
VLKSLVSAIESTEATLEDIEEAFQDMLKLKAKFKECFFSRKSRVQSSSSNFVSSNLADNPRCKTHGTKHMQ